MIQEKIDVSKKRTISVIRRTNFLGDEFFSHAIRIFVGELFYAFHKSVYEDMA